MKVLAEADGKITVLTHKPFDKEERLQDLLEHYPGLVLAGTSDEEGRVIWTIGREVGVPSGSIDLLLLDSTGHLWVVETKLAKNAEVRKQVVGQVLAYAADVATWDRAKLEEVADGYLKPRTLRDLLADEAGEDEADGIIDIAVAQAQAAHLTALVVVDDLNAVLRRLVEFVNANAKFDLLALKIETVTLGDTRLFIPTAAGVTAPDTPPAPKGQDYADLLGKARSAVQEVARRLDDLAAQRDWTTVDKGTRHYYRSQGGFLMRHYPDPGTVVFNLGRLYGHEPAEEAARIRTLLSQIEGKTITDKWPGIADEHLLAHWDRFTQEVIPAYEQAVERYYRKTGLAGN
jgi:hypothetical protein